MEMKKPKIRSMKYDEFKNNDYLERLVQQVNQDGAGVILTTFDDIRRSPLRHGALRIRSNA